MAQVFSCEFCKIYKNTFFPRTPPVVASVQCHQLADKAFELKFQKNLLTTIKTNRRERYQQRATFVTTRNFLILDLKIIFSNGHSQSINTAKIILKRVYSLGKLTIKVNDENSSIKSEICSKLTIKTPEVTTSSTSLQCF